MSREYIIFFRFCFRKEEANKLRSEMRVKSNEGIFLGRVVFFVFWRRASDHLPSLSFLFLSLVLYKNKIILRRKVFDPKIQNKSSHFAV